MHVIILLESQLYIIVITAADNNSYPEFFCVFEVTLFEETDIKSSIYLLSTVCHATVAKQPVDFTSCGIFVPFDDVL